jgi:hypothetical protein
MKTNKHFLSYLAQFLQREVSQKKKIVQNIRAHFVLSNFFFFENRVFYEIMWINIVEWNRLQFIVWRMRIA